MKINLIKRNGKLIPYADDDRNKVDKFADGAIYVCDIKNGDIRTLKQNNALHLWAEMIAKELNFKNVLMGGIFKETIEWNMELVKIHIIKATIKKVYDLNSTTKLTRSQVDGMIDYVVNAFISSDVNVPPFPNKEIFNTIEKKD
tara:strand:+ start:2395 stop:2826 length:432 start_codon:yes stop_codon:yes gene_type:complete